AISLEAQGLAASPNFKINDKKIAPPTNTMFTESVFRIPVKPQVNPAVANPKPLASAENLITSTQPVLQAAKIEAPKIETPKSEPLRTENLKTDTLKTESAIQKTLRQLDESYLQLKESVNLKKFDTNKLEDYILKAEKRSGIPYSPEEKMNFRQLTATGNTEMIKMVALELGVGVSEKAEKEAMAALGRLMVHRHQTKALQAFLNQPDKDPNLKAYVRTVMLTHKVESVLSKVEGFKRKVKTTASSPLKVFFPSNS
ncbi:MAG: hypothetical protein K2X66_15495, partial [Cyanobacteria bacterium]|nr:hypothetical protein [Cyanobacteriota bacterium]